MCDAHMRRRASCFGSRRMAEATVFCTYARLPANYAIHPGPNIGPAAKARLHLIVSPLRALADRPEHRRSPEAWASFAHGQSAIPIPTDTSAATDPGSEKAVSDTVPKWASAAISAELPGIRATGENRYADFKEAFPSQAHRLGKEIAAMASSGGGRIYIGIDDNGDLTGIEVKTGEERDDFAERAHSIARSVRPVPKVSLQFAVESGHTVLVIDIQKQSQPVFYYDSRPYIRDERRARPAEPDEVLELVWAHPSSKHKKAMEETELQRMQHISERNRLSNRKMDDAMDSIRRNAIQ